MMIRSKLIYLVLTGVLLIVSCSEAPTGSDSNEDEDPNGNEQVQEPEVSVDSPGDGEMLKGEITFSITGEAQNGFDEARIYLGEELITTIDEPSLPHEQTIATFNYDNGTYDLRAELDVADQDTTIASSISVTLENYLVNLNVDGYFDWLLEWNTQAYLFISTPSGKVLRVIDVKDYSDGELNFLPPESLPEDGAPSYYNLTIANDRNQNPSMQSVMLETYVGYSAWGNVTLSSIPRPESPSLSKTLTVDASNVSVKPGSMLHVTESVQAFGSMPPTMAILQTTFDYAEEDNNLIMAFLPAEKGDVPMYYWQENLQELNQKDTLRYNVDSDFMEMISHNVSLPSGLEEQTYQYFMSIQQDSWDAGAYRLPIFWAPTHNASSNSSVLGMYVPDIDNHLFETVIDMRDDTENISYRQLTTGAFPDEFKKLDASATISNSSVDNVEVQLSGTMDYAEITYVSLNEMYQHSWNVFAPDTMVSFTFPQIADSLNGQIENYNRSNFSLYSVGFRDATDTEGYSEFLEIALDPLAAQRSGSTNQTYYEKRINLYNQTKGKYLKPNVDLLSNRDFPGIPYRK
ncbi:hypothetical protein NC796_05425 [Aliifodinibius sp. S!AR15-10]|uniref:hypothetical protein n=1 Tax=Aliifodinibius sp. S!AR15-10 TaxID=2950437 RepID=UPI00286530AB|nr:hypothetical protein [Aliifodinibius sp. S!AR15-10]MDR8390572.1 hypothetical protein [Aliifodinibius sp. S!AR15-10]